MGQLTMGEMKCVVFRLEDEEYATGIDQVERILEFERITRIPDAPDFLKGIINYQGRIIPVIDLKKRFNLSETNTANNGKIIIARQDDCEVGLIIDDISEILEAKDDSFSPPPDIIKDIVREYVKGIIKLDKRIIIYLDLSKVLTFKEKEILNQIIS